MSSPASEPPPPVRESPGRYNRTYSGLVASLLVTVLVVLVYVGARAFTRDQPDVEPEAVGYREAVAAAQQAGITVVYPRELPDGWKATSVDYDRGDPPAWGIGMLTDDGEFVGLRQEDDDVDDLLSTYVDENVDQGDPVTIDSAVATSWQTWSDDGGDHAYSTTLDSLSGVTLLVYGSASEDDQVDLIELLTTDPMAP